MMTKRIENIITEDSQKIADEMDVLQKYPFLMVGISHFDGRNEYKIRVSVLCSVRTKKLINKKVRKQSILALNSTFLRKYRLTNLVLIWYMYPTGCIKVKWSKLNGPEGQKDQYFS